MKKLVLMAVALVMALTANAQNASVVMFGKPQFAIPGGKEGKNYAIIIESDKNVRTQVDVMTSLLRKYKIVDEVNLDEIDDKTSEFTVPFVIRQAVEGCKGMMNAPYAAAPLRLYGELRFEFHDNGKMMLVVQNLSPNLFIVTVPEKELSKSSDAVQTFLGECRAAASPKWMTKLLAWANVGIDKMDDFMAQLDEYFADLDSKFANYAAIEAEGNGKWMSPEQHVEYLSTAGGPYAKHGATALQKYIDEGRMPGVPQDRWEKSIRPVLDRLFVASNQGMGGTIVGVAEDGKDTWTSVDGKVLPTDPKLRQKYEKKDKTYLDYVSE